MTISTPRNARLKNYSGSLVSPHKSEAWFSIGYNDRGKFVQKNVSLYMRT